MIQLDEGRNLGACGLEQILAWKAKFDLGITVATSLRIRAGASMLNFLASIILDGAHRIRVRYYLID